VIESDEVGNRIVEPDGCVTLPWPRC